MNNIVMGTVQFGLNYGISNTNGKPSRDKVKSILDIAHDNEILYLDTAFAYGDSEEVIGDYLSSSSNTFNVITKIPRIEDSTLTVKMLYGYLDTSLKRLNLKKIEGLMFHDYETFYNNKSVALSFFKEIREKGIVKYTGVSVYDADQIKKIIEFDNIDLVQLPFNVFDFSVYTSGLLDILKEKGYMIHVRSVYLQGLFFLDQEVLSRKVPEAVPYIHRLNELSEFFNIPVSQICFKFVRDIMKDYGYMVVGVDNEKQIKMNCSLLEDEVLPEKLVNIILEEFNNIDSKVNNPAKWRK